MRPLVLAAVFWIAMLTNAWHAQFFVPVMGERNEFRAIWYAQATCSYVLMLGLIGLFVWLRRRARERLLREQLAIMIAGSIIPVAFNFVWVSGFVPEGVSNLTSVGLGISMVLFATGIYRDRLFAEAQTRTGPRGMPVLVPKPEHLIAMKVLAIKSDPGRTFQDLADIRYLASLPGVDHDEISSQFERHGLLDRYRELERIL